MYTQEVIFWQKPYYLILFFPFNFTAEQTATCEASVDNLKIYRNKCLYPLMVLKEQDQIAHLMIIIIISLIVHF